MLDPATAGMTVLREVSDGQRTISSRLCPATSGRKVCTYSAAWAGVLYIFQLAAMSGLRICLFFLVEMNCAVGPRSFSHLFFRQGFDARQFFAFQKLKGCAAAGRDVRNLISHAGLFYSGYRITSADDGDGLTVFGHGLGHLSGPFGKCRHFKDAHGAVPDQGAGLGDLLAEELDRFGADVKGHPVRWERCISGKGVGLGVGCELVGLDKGLADVLPSGFEEGVGHAAADEERIHFAEKIINDLNFVGYLGAAKNGDERPCRLREGL